MIRRIMGLVGGQIAFVATQLVFSIILARELGPAGRGTVAAVVATGNVLGYLFEFGGELRATAESGRGVSLRRLLVDGPFLASAALGGILTVGIVSIGQGASDLEPWPVVVYAVAVVASIIVRQYQGWLVGTMRIAAAGVIRWLLAAVSLVTLVGFAVFGEVTPETAIVAASAGALASAAIALATAARVSGSRGTTEPRASGHAVRVQLAQSGLYVLYRFDQVALGFLGYQRQLGLYSAASNVTETVQYVPTATASLIAGRGMDQPAERRLRRRVVVSTIVTAIVIGIAFEPLVGVLYGDEFRGAARYAAPLLVASTLFSFVRLLWAGLLREPDVRLFLRASLSAGALGVLIVSAGIAVSGPLGAAWGAAISFAIAGVLLSFAHRGGKAAGTASARTSQPRSL